MYSIYKRLANKQTKMKKNATKQYLENKVVNSRNDIRKFWTTMNSLTAQSYKFSSPNCINAINCLINNTDETAEDLNNHFGSTGKNLSNKVDASNSPRFSTYSARRVSSIMFLAMLPR